MQLTENGAAKKTGLEVGDNIEYVGETQIRSFDELTAALADVKISAAMLVIRASNGKRQSVIIKPVAWKIGVTVEPLERK